MTRLLSRIDRRTAVTTLAALVSAPVLAQTAASAPASGKALKLVFFYIGPVSDAGWSYAHDLGRDAIKKKFGSRVSIEVLRGVKPGPQLEQALAMLGTFKPDMVFGTTPQYHKWFAGYAEKTPGVRVERTGDMPLPKGRSYYARTYEGAYLAGVLAGKVTKSNTLGIVAPIPIPDMIANINAFALGAQSVNPKVVVKLDWILSFIDREKEDAATENLIRAGSDVILQLTDSQHVAVVTERQGKWLIGWDSDMSKIAPKSHLASSVIHWEPYYVKTVGDALDGKWAPAYFTGGVADGMIDLVSINKRASADDLAAVNAAKAKFKSGALDVWAAPIHNNQGGMILAAGSKADDMFIARTRALVRGIEGVVPELK